MWPKWIPLTLLAGITVGGCGGTTGEMAVIDAWVPPTPPNIDVAAFYVTIENGTGDEDSIASASTDRCGRIELHATQIDDDNVMMMRPAGPDLLAVDSGEVIEMVPGGLHMMCLDMPQPLISGESITVSVTFESGIVVVAEVPVEQR